MVMISRNYYQNSSEGIKFKLANATDFTKVVVWGVLLYFDVNYVKEGLEAQSFKFTAIQLTKRNTNRYNIQLIAKF